MYSVALLITKMSNKEVTHKVINFQVIEFKGFSFWWELHQIRVIRLLKYYLKVTFLELIRSLYFQWVSEKKLSDVTHVTLFYCPPNTSILRALYAQARTCDWNLVEKMIRVGAGQLLQCFGLERQALATRRLTAWRHSE